MRPLMLFAVAFAAFAAPAVAQTSPAQPVMPAPREYPNPNANMVPMESGVGVLPEGRAAASSPHVPMHARGRRHAR